MKLTGKTLFGAWLSFNTHFSKNQYDLTKYGKPMKIKDSTFSNRNDKLLFQKSEFHSVTDFATWYLTYISKYKGKRPYLIDLLQFRKEYPKYRRSWENNIQNLGIVFEQDMSYLSSLWTVAEVFGGELPKIYSEYELGNVSLESLILCDNIFGLFDTFDKTFVPKIIWNNNKVFLRQYGKFISKDRDFVGKVIKSHFS